MPVNNGGLRPNLSMVSIAATVASVASSEQNLPVESRVLRQARGPSARSARST